MSVYEFVHESGVELYNIVSCQQLGFLVFRSDNMTTAMLTKKKLWELVYISNIQSIISMVGRGGM